ncbi:MAG: hypothetical protein QNJ33_02740 [Crocosphaera sp.]|nr:hypothetical protein [Crocosphaera sp.]
MANSSFNLADLNGTNGFVINGIDSDDRSGRSVSSAGDVNGDGIDDLIIGAYSADPNDNSDAGETYVVFGSNTGFAASLDLSSLDGSNGFVLNGIDSGDGSGRAVSGAGDVNGDGIDDLIIGGSGADPNDNDRAGESYVVFGSDAGFAASLDLSSLNGSNGFVINGIDSGDGSGRAVSGAGDVNGDGIDDLIIGANGADLNGNDNDRAGESYVVFGSNTGFAASLNLSSLNGSNGFVLNGIDPRDYSGFSVSSAGDVNGDGIDDLIIGANGADPNGNSFAGESYVVFGSNTGFAASLNLSSLDGSNGFVLNGIEPGDQSGLSVSSAGDVNGDGFDDLIIGASRADLIYGGESYVVFGSNTGFAASLDLSSLDGTNGFVLNGIYGIDSYDQSGISVSGAGDVNGDGFDDLIIGAPYADSNGNAGAGESYVVFGSNTDFAASLNLSSLDGSNGFVLNGIDSSDRSGTSVSSAGDVNGDGFDDFIIGARYGDPNGKVRAGESYVIFGLGNVAPILDLNGRESGVDDSLTDSFGGTTLNLINANTTFLNDESGILHAMTLTLMDAEDGFYERLTVDTRGTDITANYRSNTGVMTLSGVDSVDNYLQVLRSLEYQNIANLPTGATRIVDIVVDDGAIDSNSSEATLTFNIAQAPTGISLLSGLFLNSIDSSDASGSSVSSAEDVNGNVAPILDLNGRESGVDDSLTEIFGGSTLKLINADTTFLNDDSGILHAMTLTLMDAEDGFYERLTIDTKGTSITANYSYNTGVMTLSGVDSVDNYLQVLRSLQYQNIANLPTGATRTVDIVVDDGVADSNSSEATLTFNIAQAPTAINLDNITIDENSANDTVIGNLTTSDPNGEDTHTYTLIDDAGGRFTLSGNQIIVADGSLLDFDTNTSHNITVRTTDSEGLAFDETLTITVNDLNDNDAPTRIGFLSGFVLNGINGGDGSGTSVSSAGDVNGDGIDDLIIGASGADPNDNSGAGETYVVFGSNTGFATSFNLSSLDGSNGFVLNGIDGADFSGSSVSGAGDVNGDGFDDLIIGADNADTNGNGDAGESYVVFGSGAGFAASLDLSSLDGNNGFVLNGIDSSDRSGHSISGAGDVNRDGFDDLIIGAYVADPNGTLNAGESYVVFGSGAGFAASLDLSSLDGSNGFVLNGIDGADWSGFSVSGAGDINGDGIDDLLIGAYLADPNGNSDAGESYVVFGSDAGFAGNLDLSSLDGSNGFVLNGIDSRDDSGTSVSGAGDVNGDGFDDLIIGANGADTNGNIYSGESYVVFGSDTGFAASLDLSSLDGSNGFVLNGIDNFDFSGTSVSGAGDVNGDGIDDLIIGASNADPNDNTNAGESYVVFGSDTGFAASIDLSSLDGSNGFVINGIDSSDFLGRSVSGAGDINGDGFDDLIIGASGADPNDNSAAGESYVVFGRSDFNAVIELANLTVAGINENSPNGTVVSTLNTEDPNIGDVHTYTLMDDAGGRFAISGNELIVADGTLLDFESNTSHDVTVRTTDSGGLDFDETFTIQVNDVNESATAIALDNTIIDENSSNDTVIGNLNTTDPDAGDTHTYTLVDDAEGRFAISGNQLIVADGSLLDFESNSSHNITVRTTDSEGLTFDETFTIQVNDVNESATAIALDSTIIDENSANNTVIGNLSTTDADAGDTHTYTLVDDAEGRFALSGNQIIVANGSLLDFESNSSHDITVRTTDSEGLAFDETFTITVNDLNDNDAPTGIRLLSGFIINGIDNFDYSGGSVSGAGDVNGDGIDDLIIGAYFADPNENSDAGESYVVFGSDTGFAASLDLSSLDGSNGFVLNGIDSGDGSGGSVSSAGDVNGDGFDDLIIGASGTDPNDNSNAGESYVVFGSDNGFAASLDLSSLDGSNGFVLNGIDSGDRSGRSVSGAGDVNGDGFDDLIIGASNADPNGKSDAGESYVVFGSDTGFATSLDLSSLDGNNGFVLNGIDIADYSGFSVSSAGDVNGDGFDDLIIGALLADPNGKSDPGESYVVFGSDNGFAASLDLSSLDGSNGFVLNGIDSRDLSGRSVSGAGDVNGDGIDDLIIGASNADPNDNTNAGESYVVFGSDNGFAPSLDLSSLDGNNGFVLNGIDSRDRSGSSVSSAGDVNGDGIDDLIIGAEGADPNGNIYSGESYVVFGSDAGFAASFNLSSLDGSNGFVINGIHSSDRPGGSVSSAGDVNGDGFDDLIIGASNANPNGNIYSGESYVVFGRSNFDAVIELANLTVAGINESVNENSPNGTVVSTLNTEDPNIGDSHTYTLVDDAGGRFAISGNQIIVADGTLLDFESNTSHDITVRTTDSGGLDFDETFTIQVNDILNENQAPTALNLDNTTIHENSVNSTFIGNLSTTDPDAGDSHTYTLVDDAEGRFAINGNQIIVADGTLLDFETNTSHIIEVQTSDGEFTFNQQFTININDIDEIESNIITAENQKLGEADTITLDHNRQTIAFDHTYNNPVIFTPSVSFNGGQLATPRITNVTSNSFDIYLQEPINEDGSHTSETLSYFVFEAGTYQLSDGTLVEVGSFDSDATSTPNDLTLTPWQTVEFDIEFADTPVIFSQVQTDNETDLVRTRQQNATADGFEVVMEEDEIKGRNSEGHSDETIGYLAIASGSGNSNGVTYQAASTSNSVTHDLFNINFGGEFTDIPHFLANIATYDGPDASALRFQNLTTNGVQVTIQEDTTFDGETSHTTEVVNYLAIEGDNGLQGTAYDPLTGNRAIIGTDSNDYLLGLAENDTRTGKGGNDIFVLETNQGTDTITDFELGVDRIGLADSLSFGALTLTDINNDTSVMFDSQELAIFKGIQSTQLTNDHFVEVTV